ncbi:MAG: hypothetical protein ABI988_03040 [Nitrospirota bacterium]
MDKLEAGVLDCSGAEMPQDAVVGTCARHRLLEISLPPDILNAIFEDFDVLVLAQRMPKSLLAKKQDGIDEHDGPALYFSLKNTE